VVCDEISTLNWITLSGILQVTTDGRILGEALSSQVAIHTSCKMMWREKSFFV